MTTGLQNALLIHNPSAGNGRSGRRRVLDEARRIFSAAGIQVDLAETGGPGHATELARQAMQESRQLVIACGGDGTLNEVVNGLATAQNGRRVPLALLPGGTANILAKELNLPWDIPSAAEKLLHGEIREIALGLATPVRAPERKKYFVSVAGAGPDGMIVYSLDLALKARIGILAYWWQGAREVLRYKFPRFRVRIPRLAEAMSLQAPEPKIGPDWPSESLIASEQELNASLVVVGRTKHYGGPFQITTEADLYQDRFEIMALTTQSAFRYLRYLPALYFGKLRRAEGVFFFKSNTVICEPFDENPVHAQMDGECLAPLPVEFQIVPRALQLLVPS
jgi:diacylglycerol kinase family enzyme